MRRKTVIITALLLLFAFAVPAFASGGAADEAKTVYYEPDLEAGLPPGTDVVFGDGGLVYTGDGKLNIVGSDTYPPVTTVLFPYRISESEYVFECDVSFYSVLSENCRFSLCFGAQSEDLLYQFSVKPRADLSDSAALLCKSGASSWKTVADTAISDHISEKGLNKYKFPDGNISLYVHYSLMIAVKNGTAFGYIDGVKVIEGRLNGSSSGKVGFSCRGMTVKISGVKLHNELPYSVSAADSFSAEPGRPDTGIIEPPSIMQRDRQGQKLQRGASSVLFTVRAANGSLHCYDGAVDLGELDQRLPMCEGSAIPAFYVSDEETASALSAFMSANFINDAFVIVSQTSLCGYFSANRYVRIALDLSSRDEIGADDVYRLLYRNSIRTLILSGKAVRQETVTSLRERMISVWASCSADPVDLFNAARFGAECIITSDASAAAGVFGSVSKTTLMREPIVISDGGDTNSAPSNTLTALQSAYKSGVNALYISVRNTKDGALVLSKTDTTDKMSENCVISETPLSYLKTLTYGDQRVSADERILTLEELFGMTSDRFSGAVFHIYTESEENADKAIKLAYEYGICEKCVIVSSERSVINAVNAASEGAAASYSGGPYVFDSNDRTWSLSSLCETLVSLNSAYRGGAEGVPAEFLASVHQRGIPVYISDAASAASAELMLAGYDGFTVQTATEASKYVRTLSASVDGGGRLSARIVYFDGTSLDVTALCELLPLEGGVSMRGGVISGEGSYAVVCPQTAQNGEKYYVCSAAATTGHRTEITTESPEEDYAEENNTVTVITIIAAGAVFVGGVVVFVAVLIRGKRKSNEDQET